MNIGLDLDGVLCDFISTMLIDVNAKYGMSISYEDIIDYQFERTLIPKMTSKEFYNLVETNETFLRCNPVLGSLTNCKLISWPAGSCSISIITARPQRTQIINQTVKWLKKYNIPFNDFLMTKHPKTELCRKHSVDIFVDDNPTVIKSFEGCDIPCVCFDQPWNRAYNAQHRVSGWNNLYDLLVHYKNFGTIATNNL